jgi:heme-degrading monooxygenase HmoA
MRILTCRTLGLSLALGLMLANDQSRTNLLARDGATLSKTERRSEMLVVLYRWKPKPGGEAIFQEGWREMTESIYRTRGSLGSRLHRAEDGTWLGYAQWPNEEAWRKSQESGSASKEAGEKMKKGATLLSTERLRIVEDLLRPKAYN